MKMMKIILVSAMSVLCLIYTCACFDTNFDVYIFQDIKECQNIIANKDENTDIEVFDTPNDDKYLKDLRYNDFFSCRYSCDDFDFEMFAYEFVDSDTSKEYFENVTDRTSERDSDFLSWGGILSYSRVVIDGKNAYIIHSSTSNQEKINKFISTVFSVKLY